MKGIDSKGNSVNIQALLSDKVSQALTAAGAPADSEAQVRQSAKAQFGDYQANGVMSVAKKLGMAPRQLAEKVVELLDLSGIASKVEIAGPGFINIFLDRAFVAANADNALQDAKLGISPVEPQTIVIDYSAPNVAKEMHVGHVRSTIIGDAAARTNEFLGHKVIRANHVGDWGTQFGMLIAYLEKVQNENAGEMKLSDLEEFYRAAKKNYDEDEEFAVRARNYVVKLQGGDEYCRQMWRKLVDVTMAQNQITYDRLNVTLTRDDVMGESLYNDMLPGIVSDLQEKGLAVDSEGAVVVYLDEYKNKEGELVLKNRQWHEANNTYGFSKGLGILIMSIGVLTLLGIFTPKIGIFGELLVIVMTIGTLSFLVTTPECWVPDLGSGEHGFPLLSGAGRLVLKDIVILSGAVVLLSDSAKKLLAQCKL